MKEKKMSREESRKLMLELIEETKAAGVTEESSYHAIAKRDAIYRASREEVRRMIADGTAQESMEGSP
jgi:hypothetical protein